MRRTAFRQVTSRLTGGWGGWEEETNRQKRYSQVAWDGFAERRRGDDDVESEEEGMIGGWSKEEGEGVIDVDVAANEEREHHRQNTV